MVYYSIYCTQYGILIYFLKAKRRDEIMVLLKKQREERIKVRFFCLDVVREKLKRKDVQ